MNNKVQNLYEYLCQKHGASPAAVKARDETQQKLRFINLLRCADIAKTDSFLDMGCGTGSLLHFIRDAGFQGDYIGLDFVDEFISHAKTEFVSDKNATFQTFDIENEKLPASFDWYVLSGVFNDVRDNSEDFMYSTLLKMFESSRKGIIFNSLSKYVDYEDSGLFYSYPDKVFQFCVKNLSKSVVLRTDYQLRENVIPFEYSMAVTKCSFRRRE